MKNKKLFITLILSLFACLISAFFTACGSTEKEEDGLTFKTLMVEDTTVYGVVSNATTEFSFIDEVTANGNAKFVVALDKNGMQTVITKTITLQEGNNTVYLFETVDDEITNTYTITIYRISMYTVTFNTNGGTSVESQTVEENYLATEPEAPTRVGYTFTGWDYDFATPITQDTEITANFEEKEEMSNFNFTSTTTTCIITDIKDKSITEITIPDYVTHIGNYAFRDCWSLKSITIPNSVTNIGKNAFEDCTSLTNISCPAFAISYIPKLELKIVVITSGESIGDDAFYNHSNLTSVEIGDGVTSIGDRAFCDCDSLTSVTIPDSVTSIGDDAFNYCRSLTSITIPDSVTGIGKRAFKDCTRLQYNVKGGLNYLGNSNNPYIYLAIATTTSTTVTIENGCKFIGDSAFHGCRNLTEIVIPDGVTSISDDAFSYCWNLTSITIPDNVTSIGNSVFYCCSSLTSITIPDSVTSIGNSVFYGCGSLTSMVIPDSVMSIGDYAFRACSGLTSITIPSGVTSIGDYAFNSCYKLVEVVNKSTYITVEKGSTSNGYVGYYALAVYNSGDTFTGTKLSNDNGYIVYTDGSEKILVHYTGMETDLVLPTYITKINRYAFYGYSNLTSITFNGTKAQWNAIEKGYSWADDVPATEVICTDGTVSI